MFLQACELVNREGNTKGDTHKYCFILFVQLQIDHQTLSRAQTRTVGPEGDLVLRIPRVWNQRIQGRGELGEV